MKNPLCLNKLYSCILFAVLPAILFYCMAIIGLKLSGIGIMEILKDPAQLSEKSSFLGFISNIGVWLWVSSTAIAFFSAFSQKKKSNGHRKELILLIGILSLILAVDDFFMIHDRYINQYICYLGYAVCAGALLIRHYKTIFEVNGVVFLLAGALLGLSIFVDVTQDYIPLPYNIVQVFEEGFKFVGAATWLYFCCHVASYETPTKEKA